MRALVLSALSCSLEVVSYKSLIFQAALTALIECPGREKAKPKGGPQIWEYKFVLLDHQSLGDTAEASRKTE